MSEALHQILDHARASAGPLVILTGAGISADSGIPTFRGEEGFWKVGSRNYHPQEMATMAAFRSMPEEVWSWYLYRWGVCRAAEPNVAHEAVVAAERAFGDRFTLITQNVDGLHLRAGNTMARTFQIHGNIDYMRCAAECTHELFAMPEGVRGKDKGESVTSAELELLVCPECGERTRPHVLWFDETYNEHFFRFDSSLTAADACRLLIVVGTSAGTNLPNHVVGLACASGAKVIDINPQRNPFSALATSAGGLWLQGSAAEQLPDVIARLTG